MADITAWIQAHWLEIGVIALALHTLLKAIADATKNTVDDNIVAWIGKVVGYLFGKRPN